MDCGGLRAEGTAKCQEAVGTSGIPPLVSVAPSSPEFSVDIDSFCFVTVALYGFVLCKKWNSNGLLPLNQWGCGGQEQ